MEKEQECCKSLKNQD